MCVCVWGGGGGGGEGEGGGVPTLISTIENFHDINGKLKPRALVNFPQIYW